MKNTRICKETLSIFLNGCYTLFTGLPVFNPYRTHAFPLWYFQTYIFFMLSLEFFIDIILPDRLRWSRRSVLAFGTQVRGFKPGRSRRIFKDEKILSTPSFGGEVKPSVPCRRFAAFKRSLELGGSRILDEICRNISRPRRVPPSAARDLSRRWTWRHLAEKVGESNGNLPLRICPGCSVPEPYRSPDWVLVPAKTGLRAEY